MKTKHYQKMEPDDLRSLVFQLANDRSKKSLLELDSLLEFIHFNCPALEREPEVKEVISFYRQLRRAGFVEKEFRVFSAGAFGLGKR